MQLSARETAAKPLPADLLPVNASFVPSVSAFNRRHRAFADRAPANFPTLPIKPACAAGSNARAPRIAALSAVPGHICLNAQP
jgi:hypothetical protein